MTLVWFAEAPVPMTLVVTRRRSEERREVVSGAGGRYRVGIEGLRAGTAYPYRILAGDRVVHRGVFRTNRPAGRPFRFVVLGDSGTGERAQHDVARQIDRADPDLILHTGDLVYDTGDRSDDREEFFLPWRDLLGRVPLWPARGDRGIFELPANGPQAPERTGDYWFDYGGARFVVVNTEHPPEHLRTTVAPWLEAILSPGEIRWRFVVGHRPERSLAAACERARVDLVLTGGEAETSAFTRIDVDGSRLELRRISRRGRPLERRTLRKAESGKDR